MLEEMIIWTNANQGLSAWVQALGSLFALGIAIWLPIHQSNREKAKAIRSEVEYRYKQVSFIWSSVGMVIDEAKGLMDNIEQEPYPISKFNADQTKSFESILLSLDEFPIHELDTAPMVTLALEMRRDCHKVTDLIIKALAEAEASQKAGIDVDLRFIQIKLNQLKEKHAKWSEQNTRLFNLVYRIKGQ